MTVTAPRSRMTAEELFDLPDDGGRSELVEGELVPRTPTGGRHAALAVRIGRLLDEYVEARDLGVCCGPGTGFILQRNPDTVRAPDAAVVLKRPAFPTRASPPPTGPSLPTTPSKSSRHRTASRMSTSRSPSTSRPGRAWSGSWNRKPGWSMYIGRHRRSRWLERMRTSRAATCCRGSVARCGGSSPRCLQSNDCCTQLPATPHSQATSENSTMCKKAYLDTAHWIDLAQGNGPVVDFEEAVSDGKVVPVLSYTHLLELAQQQEDGWRTVSLYIDRVRGMGKTLWAHPRHILEQAEVVEAFSRFCGVKPPRIQPFGDSLVETLPDDPREPVTEELKSEPVESHVEKISRHPAFTREYLSERAEVFPELRKGELRNPRQRILDTSRNFCRARISSWVSRHVESSPRRLTSWNCQPSQCVQPTTRGCLK